jgi:hypothetical protein
VPVPCIAGFAVAASAASVVVSAALFESATVVLSAVAAVAAIAVVFIGLTALVSSFCSSCSSLLQCC